MIAMWVFRCGAIPMPPRLLSSTVMARRAVASLDIRLPRSLGCGMLLSTDPVSGFQIHSPVEPWAITRRMLRACWTISE